MVSLNLKLSSLNSSLQKMKIDARWIGQRGEWRMQMLDGDCRVPPPSHRLSVQCMDNAIQRNAATKLNKQYKMLVIQSTKYKKFIRVL